MSKFKIAKGIIWKIVRPGDRRGFEDLQTAMDDMSKSSCCGVDRCDGVLRIKDRVTGNIAEIAVDNGEITLTLKDPVTGEIV